ncbi:MAG TPA: preprotein translocase subunit YajC [Gaiellaceae bacterium]|jgi:preprotein translocase subunit YajC
MNPAPLIFIAAMVAVFWFLLIRPQRQRQAAHRAMVGELGPGDEVITVGGVFGQVKSVADDHLLLEIAPGTEIRLAKEAVATVIPKDAEPAQVPADRG